MKLFQLFISVSCIFLVACGDIDLSQYATDLSTEVSKAKFPAYVELMSDRVKNNVVKHFKDDCRTPSFVIVSDSHSNTTSHMKAASLELHIVEIHLDKLYQDKLQSKLAQVLQNNYSPDTIFYIRHTKEHPVDWKVIEKYQSIVESTESHSKEHMQFEFIPLTELISYAEKMAEVKNYSKDDAKKATLLTFAFLPHNAFFDVIEQVLEDSKNAPYSNDAVLDAVFTQVQTRAPTHQHIYLKHEMHKFAAKYSHADDEQVETLNTLVRQISNPFLSLPNSITDMLNEHFEVIFDLARENRQTNFDIERVTEEFRHALVGITKAIKRINK